MEIIIRYYIEDRYILSGPVCGYLTTIMSVQSVETLRDSLGKAQRSQLLSVSRYKNPLQAKRVQGARIVECPQNTVELRMLIDKLSSIEKNKRRRISNLDSERYLMKLKYKELLTGKATTMSEDMLLLPPGFRYHANGEPKKVKTGPLRLAKTRALGKTNIRNSATSEGSEQPTNQPKSIEDDILATEEALQDTKRDRALHAISRKISNVRCKMTFLRAHSKREEARTSCVPKGKGTSKSEQFSKSCEEVRPVCKHSSDAFGSHCLQVSGFRDTCIRERWKSVPSGRYVPSPRPGQSKVSSIVSTPRSKTSRSKTGSCNEKTSVRAMSINNQQGSKSQLTCWSTPSLAHRTESETTKRQREFHAKNIRNVREHNGNSSSTNVLEYSSIGPNRTQNILYCHSTGNTRATPRHNNRESRSNIPSKEQDQTKCKTIQTQTATPIENDERKRVDSGETKSRRDSYTDGANQVSVATSTEDSYRYTMRRGSTTDEAKLAILRTILDAEGVTKSQGGNGIKSKGSTCRLQMSKQAIQQIHSLNDLADDAGAVKKQVVSFSTFKTLAVNMPK